MLSKQRAGFTIIELLVVIAIVGLLSSIILVSLNSARVKARTARRVVDLKNISTALEIYFNDNGAYPIASSWRSQCLAWGGHAPSDVIPGLVSNYLSAFPSDPSMNVSDNKSCYLYTSNGTDYKLLDHDVTELSGGGYLKQSTLVDPTRDGGTGGCIVDGSNPWSWAVWTSGAACW